MGFYVQVLDKAGNTIKEENFNAHHSALKRFRQLRRDVYGGVYDAENAAKVTLEKTGKAGKSIVLQAWDYVPGVGE